MIGFQEIPQNLRVPLFFAELDNSRANSGQQTQRTLIIGQQHTSTGTLAANQPVLAEGLNKVKARAGFGSQLALMLEWYRKRDRFGEVWLLPVTLATPTAATRTVTVTGAATEAGQIALYVGGQRVLVGVANGAAANAVASSIASAVNAASDLPMMSSVASNVVTLTAKNAGLLGNDLDARLNYLGSAGGESTPLGLTLEIAAGTAGAGTPNLSTALANLGDMEFDFIVCPYNDTGSLNALRDFLAARWAWDKMLYGGAFSAFRGTLGEATTFGLTRNDPHVSIMPFNGSPTPAMVWAANSAGAYAVSLRADPGLPLHGLRLDVLAPPIAQRFTIGERNVLLFGGLSTHTVGADGTVTTETIVTTYQRNPQGSTDDSYLYVERLYVLAAVIRDLKAFATSTFGRFKLASDGAPVAPGARIVTPALIKDAILGRYRFLERQGLVQEYDTFAANLVVERNGTNRCRVDGLLPIIPVDQLRQIAALVQFRNSGEEV